MPCSQKPTTSKKTANSKSVRRKNSIEDLEEEGYSIGELLGEGSYSKVKLAEFEGKKMAVKIITKNQLSLDFKTKFLPRELNALAKVKHPHIVHVHKIFCYPRRIFIFMELIERGDLLKLINDGGRLVESKARKYFKQMVSALTYLHSLNIGHRDLKCENIMINDEDHVKIIDFGFARVTVNKAGRRELSRTFCGSTAYAAPEILQGMPYNPLMSDVWSLGCILYIMVTGTMPFDDSHRRKMLNSQLKKQYKSQYTVDLTNNLKTLISHMLEPDVTKRATMKQVSQSSWLQLK